MVESVTKGGQKQPFSQGKDLTFYPTYQFLDMPFSRYLLHFFQSRKPLFSTKSSKETDLENKGIDFIIILAGILVFSFLELGFCFGDFRCNLLVTFPLGSVPFLRAWGQCFFIIIFFTAKNKIFYFVYTVYLNGVYHIDPLILSFLVYKTEFLRFYLCCLSLLFLLWNLGFMFYAYLLYKRAIRRVKKRYPGGRGRGDFSILGHSLLEV